MRRWPIPLVLASLVLGGILLPGARAAAPPPKLDAYRGLGSWVDIYDKSQYYDPASTIQALASHGVRTLFLETANYNSKKDIVFPGEVDQFIDDAHAAGMRIVAWYLPSFNNPARDLRRSLAVIQRVTSTGGRFDSFGLDIEADVVSDPNLRTQRLLQISAAIRSAAGPSYPLSAIIPDPLNMQRRPDYWPGFPFAPLTQYFNVFQPMSYYTFHTNTPAGAYRYIAGNISIVREQTGKPSIPIHIIGGIADASGQAEDRAMVHAVRERGIIGASLYDFATSTDEDWLEMAKVPVNPVEYPALPLALPATPALGNIPGGDRTHPKEVIYSTGGVTGPATLRFKIFDVQTGEVALLVNWRMLRDVVPSGAGKWSAGRVLEIPASFLHANSTNTIGFVAVGDYPHWSVWGVRNVSLG